MTHQSSFLFYTGTDRKIQSAMIAFIDTEVSADSRKVKDIGVVREDGATLHTRSSEAFGDFVSQHMRHSLWRQYPAP